ncbi:extracellular solute-binding protein [Dysosmobacter sp.]
MKRRIAWILALTMAFSLTACGSKAEKPAAEEGIDWSTLTVDDVIAKGKEEGAIESVGMPDNWANWVGSFKAMNETYGLTHTDVDLSSAEEVALFVAEKDDPTRDIGDVGFAFVDIAKDEGVLWDEFYKPTTWDSIPDWAKDENGAWVMSYTGTICFMVNDMMSGNKVPDTWDALLNDTDLVVSPGNVVGGASSQAGVLSCALAMGGSFDNVQPGIDYFKKLAEQGRLDPGDITKDRLKTGEIQVMVGRFDFDGISYRDQINAENVNDVHITTVIPQDGAITTGYCLIMNRYTPRPYATALAVEYLLSDEGQIDRAYGGARPIRSDVDLPDDVPLLDDSFYTNTTSVDDRAAFAEACAQISTLWEEEVLPLLS